MLAAFLFVFDGLNTIEDRLILVDSQAGGRPAGTCIPPGPASPPPSPLQLIFWCCVSLLVAQVRAAACTREGVRGPPFPRLPPPPLWVSSSLASSPHPPPPHRQMWWRRHNVHTEALEAYARAHGGAEPSPEEQARLGACEGRPFFLPAARLAWAVGLGVACGNALSIKWTTLATPGMIGEGMAMTACSAAARPGTLGAAWHGRMPAPSTPPAPAPPPLPCPAAAVESFFALFFLRRPLHLALDLLPVAAAAAAVYAFYFWLHFALLPKAGDGDGFMPVEFQVRSGGGGSVMPVELGRGRRAVARPCL